MNVLDILKSPWAIEPQALTEMCAIYAAHRNGEKTNADVIEKILMANGKSSVVVAAAGKGQSGAKNYEVQDGVALIPIEGILAKRMGLFQMICGGQSYTSLQQDLAQALADPSVTSIILTIDSPGGTVDGCEAAGNAIFNARSQKPIVAYVDGKATSAAYWLGSAASQMYIGSDADAVGSIGVLMTHIDTSAAETMRGERYTDLTAGRYKATGTSHRPLSGQDVGIMQDQLDQLYGNFIDTVARNRGTDAQTVHKNMGDGRVFIGQKAIDAGLVDGKVTLPALVQRMGSPKGRVATAASRNGGAPSRPRSEESSAPALAVSSSTNVPEPVAAPKPPEPPVTKEQMAIAKLRILNQEETSTRRLLKDAEASLKTANLAVAQASRIKTTAEAILPYTTAVHRAQVTIEDLRNRLKANDAEQSAVLRDVAAKSQATEVAESAIDPVVVASQANSLVSTAKVLGESVSLARAVARVIDPSSTTLAEQARAMVAEARSEGRRLSYAAAVSHLMK
jgi:signal peptide peptidase SppA